MVDRFGQELLWLLLGRGDIDMIADTKQTLLLLITASILERIQLSLPEKSNNFKFNQIHTKDN